MTSTPGPTLGIRRLGITIRGIVQGVGFRPFVYRTARKYHLQGWVLNDTGLVRIEVEGPQCDLDRFLNALRHDAPRQARVEQIDVHELPTEGAADATGPREFEIRQSDHTSSPQAAVPADLATCDECLAELLDPAAVRYRYPFTNCTNCGPRWSIITRLPYDRPHTSMRGFMLCDLCRGQYEDPGDRRFHAQPIACPHCGPQLALLASDGRLLAQAEEALQSAVEALKSGGILALKGLGGFQLLVDATDETATRRLRIRKQRPDKPFAIMLANAARVQQYCRAGQQELDHLASAAAPILLLRRGAPGPELPPLAAAVAPGNPRLGVMLPYTPLHHLLTQAIDRPLICTSGNRSEEPIVTGTEEALSRLADIADWILTNDRPIVRPVDDSVARVEGGRLQLLRRARGYAPRPLPLGRAVPCMLAVGGHLKNTVALSVGTDAVISPHVGDLDNSLSMEVHRRAIADLVDFFQVQPELIACDLHPDYRSTRHAEQLARQWDVPLVRIQHHHAHVLSAMAEHRLAGPVLGFSWDGTGYGTDGVVWGGEALRVDGHGFERVAHLLSFPLPGGDRVAREPRRAALGLLFEMLGRESAQLSSLWFGRTELRTLFTALERPGLFPRCTSMGRLFDAVAAILGLPPVITFEGQAAMALEYAADEAAADESSYAMPQSGAVPAVVDWRPLLQGILRDRAAGCPVSLMAARFHRALAAMAVDIARRVDCRQIVLTGGCFQNAVLTRLVRDRLSEAGFDVYTQQQVPPGDGGIALGQLLGAAWQVGE